MKYTAINIGPIVKTLDMARKPRELWAASYLFSYLMKCIIKALPNKDTIISPDTFDENEKNGVGLYPDRVFVKGEVNYESLKPAVEAFAKTVGIPESYFNVMLVSGEYDKDSAAIKHLNGLLDRMELFNMADGEKASDRVRNFLIKDNNALLVKDAFTGNFPRETLGEIAAVELQPDEAKSENKVTEEQWKIFVSALISDDKEESAKAYKKLPKEKLKSYHKYICVVQADGDNVGATVTHSQLPEGKVKEISTKLLGFGQQATSAIRDFGGLPIYAGGDDLLFVAPVVGKDGKSILWLLEHLNQELFGEVTKLVDHLNLKFEEGKNKGKDIHTSLSFGVSISYYKYPLYETLESARNQLFFKAKNVDGKNAIALDWRKNSGGAFAFEFSKSKTKLKEAFDKMVEASEKKVVESVVTAVAHKIRENEGLLKLWIDSDNYKERNSNFFQKYLEYQPNKEESKKSASDKYKDAAMALLNELYETETDVSKLTQTMYGMLRLAKFIKGEEVIDD